MTLSHQSLPIVTSGGDTIVAAHRTRHLRRRHHRRVGFSGYEDGWFGFVFRSGWASSGSSDNFDGSFVGGGGGGGIFLGGCGCGCGAAAVGFLGGVAAVEVVTGDGEMLLLQRRRRCCCCCGGGSGDRRRRSEVVHRNEQVGDETGGGHRLDLAAVGADLGVFCLFRTKNISHPFHSLPPPSLSQTFPATGKLTHFSLPFTLPPPSLSLNFPATGKLTHFSLSFTLSLLPPKNEVAGIC